jgi:hypothetical protein
MSMSGIKEMDLLRTVETEHLKLVAAESKAREESLAARIAMLQEDLNAAKNMLSESSQGVVLSNSDCVMEANEYELKFSGENVDSNSTESIVNNMYRPIHVINNASLAAKTKSSIDSWHGSMSNGGIEIGVQSSDFNRYLGADDLSHGRQSTANVPVPALNDTPEDDPLEVLGRLVESTLGKQVCHESKSRRMQMSIVKHLQEAYPIP